MCTNKNNCRNRNLCKKHNPNPSSPSSQSSQKSSIKYCNNNPKKSETLDKIDKIDQIVIPVIPMDQLPGPDTLKNGSIYLVGKPMSKTDPMPDARKYQLAISNGDYYFAFTPNMILA
jgi:hypothetical protein